jgi:phenylacetate-CoA ligase
MEKVIYAGAPLAPSDRKWLKEALGARRIASVIGANDGGQLAFQCEHLEGQFHHLVDDYNYAEILDDKKEPVADGTAGTMVITSLEKYAYPLIRYELGDAGRIVPESCACGRTNRIIEYLGRSDDTMCIGLLNLRYRDVQAALSHLPLSVIQVVGRHEATGEYLVLKVECEAPSPTLEGEIRSALNRAMPPFEYALQHHELQRLDVEILAPGAIPRNTRTGKVKLWVDERK